MTCIYYILANINLFILIGCPELKKQLFLRDLMDLMQEKMTASNTDSDETTAKWQASKEERIATWHFVMLDKNKNKVYENIYSTKSNHM